MAIRSLLAVLSLSILLAAGTAATEPEPHTPPSPKAISDLRDAIVKNLGLQAEGLRVSGFDVRDALVGHAAAYEFHIEVGKKMIPLRLLEDVSLWDFADLSIFRPGAAEAEADGKEITQLGSGNRRPEPPSLPPFQLAGPMELWIQDSDDVRLALPHDVETGLLKKVVLSDGAVVTVKGARSVSLRSPLELPLPLNRTTYKGNRLASGLISIAQALRGAARSTQKPLLSLRIVGPTSLTSAPSSKSSTDRLKLKRLAPGQVELSSRSDPAIVAGAAGSPVDAQSGQLWPLTSLDGSDATLRGFEELLASVLGKAGEKEEAFRLVKAQVSAQTYVKMGFAVERRLKDGDVDWSGYPSWKTKPKKAKAHFEVLARVEESGKVIPERVAEVRPFDSVEAMAESVLTGNVSMSTTEIIHPPPVYFTL